MTLSVTPVVKYRTQLKLASVKRELDWLMLLRSIRVDPEVSGTAGSRGSSVMSASDFSPSLSSPSVRLPSFSVSWWSLTAPEFHPPKFKSRLNFGWVLCQSVPEVRELGYMLHSQSWEKSMDWGAGRSPSLPHGLRRGEECSANRYQSAVSRKRSGHWVARMTNVHSAWDLYIT